MSPRIVQDIIPTQKKSIRDIPVPPSREKRTPIVDAPRVPMYRNREPEEPVEEYTPPTARNPKKYFIIGGIVVFLVALFFTINAFAHATVTVVLATQNAQVNSSFTTRSATSSTSGITDYPVTLTETGYLTVTASGTQDVETKATGSIIIFNDYSTAPQKLVANTRFSTSDGLIYRINQSVTVPGKSTKSGKDVPGSVTTTVTADQVGDKYNIDLSDFTIPGFKGEPQFDGFFGRSQTPMTGGFSGERPIVGSADRAAAETSIRANLQSQIAAAALATVPAGYILYPGAYRIDYQSLPDTIGSSNKVTINERATFTGFALKKDDIDMALAASAVKSYSGEPITITNIDALTFSTAAVPVATSSTMAFKLSGTADFVWPIDARTFSSQLAGKSKSDFTTILQGYPHVDKASVSFFPFWLRHFPGTSSDITIATSSAI